MRLLAILAVLIMFSACRKRSCDCKDEHIILHTHDSSVHWLPTLTADTVYYKNAAGFRSAFISNGMFYDTSGYGQAGGCYDLGCLTTWTYRTTNVNYKSQDINLQLQYSITKNQFADTIDILALRLNQEEWLIPLESTDKYIFLGQQKVDTLNEFIAGQKKYTDVLYVHPNYDGDTSHGVYYARPHGIIAFKLGPGQSWYKE